MNDTIAAISTARGVGAISIIRVSGKYSIKIVNKIFKGCDLEKQPTHTIHYGYIMDEETKIDEVLVSIMKSPRTYTKEDIVEINCHGGINTTNKVLEIVLNNGARLAEPGEFTKRAFLNGRLDLAQSEAVMDIINSVNNDERLLALKQLEGKTAQKIKQFRNELNDLIANIEVNIDYPEYHDIEVMTNKKIENIIASQIKELKNIIKQSEESQILKHGLKTLIIGRPNVGKSSILNNLLEYDKAIVTDIEGTTRDVVEGDVIIDGITLNIIDTAGIRKTEDVIEQIGVKKSISLIDEADLVLVVLNGQEKLTEEDMKILDKTKNKTNIVIINKSDLAQNIELELLKDRILINTTTTKLDGLDILKNKISELYNLDKIRTFDQTYLSNARQVSLAKSALKSLQQAEKSIKDDIPIDLIQLDILEAFDKLGEIIGITYSDEVIDNLFKNFCVGK